MYWQQGVLATAGALLLLYTDRDREPWERDCGTLQSAWLPAAPAPEHTFGCGGHCGEKTGQAVSDTPVAGRTHPTPDHSSIPKLGRIILSSLPVKPLEPLASNIRRRISTDPLALLISSQHKVVRGARLQGEGAPLR